MKEGFCLNSKRWINLMARMMGGAPNSCPRQTDQFVTCQDCGYYEEREPTKYLLRIKKILKLYENDERDEIEELKEVK